MYQRLYILAHLDGMKKENWRYMHPMHMFGTYFVKNNYKHPIKTH